MKYTVTIDVPVMMRVEAESDDEAADIGSARFARMYERLEAALTGDDVWLGARYDDTDVSQEEPE